MALAPSLADPLLRATLDSLTRHGHVPTSRNYSVWYEYHEGHNPGLRGAIDEYVAAQRPIDATAMLDLYERFIANDHEQRALQDSSRLTHETIQEVAVILGKAGTETAVSGKAIEAAATRLTQDPRQLPAVIAALVAETGKMQLRSEALGSKLLSASRQIQELEQRLSQARREATIDPLTEVLNRRAFGARARLMTGLAEETDEPLALLMIDIDRFKGINDTWGHPVGDAVLRLVAQTLKQSARDSDLVARYGGEEFAVMLPKVGLNPAMAVAERIRQAVAARNLTLRDTGQSIGSVTISVGAALYHAGEPLTDLIGRADEALLLAKQSGRNRVMTVELCPV